MISQDNLEQQVLLLASRDWKTRRAARDALIAAGGPGLSAAVEGMRHPEPPVRRGCVDFLDHHADDDCVNDLRQVALYDPIPKVRRFAVHALGCVRCKASPLDADLIEFFAMVAARSDESAKVRREAIYALSHLPQDSRAAAALRLVLEQETDQELRKAAHRVLRLHDPEYRRWTDEQARQASLARRSGIPH
ncbi:MAG: HEAT repeat domain-containing protein [Chloroflexi bacterium]|nr:HEAT repeat domain-containing protein [Chloroflexota bacterium]